jgi:hypothetical protein
VYFSGTYYYNSVPGTGEIGTEIVEIDVEQYGGVYIERYSSYSWVLTPDSFVEVYLKIYNNGNGDDLINISFIDPPEGLRIEGLPAEITIPRGGARQVYFKLMYEGDDDSTMYLELRAESQYPGTGSKDTINVEIRPDLPEPPGANVWFFTAVFIALLIVFISGLSYLIARRMER